MSGPRALAGRPGGVGFRFDGRAYQASPGDTLAAALLANGVGRVARSFKHHRPRGIMAAGVEEPSALVTVGAGGRREPNTRATDVFVYEGLEAASQNRWPSLAFDLGAVNGLVSPLIPAGFYYKTFFGPPRLWMVYEHFIRRAAGLGRPPSEADPDGFEHRAAFCDLLVVGAGPAGLAAAWAAARAGRRVMLVEQDREAGGALLRDPAAIDGTPAPAWIAQALDAVRAAGGRVLTRTTATGYWDHDLVTLVQRLAEPGAAPGPGGLAQRLWRVRPRAVVLAGGAIERPLSFPYNDRPGVMLAQAARTYVRRFGVLPGGRAVVATTGDDGYRTAFALADAGAEVAAVLDARAEAPAGLLAAARERFPVHLDAAPVKTRGAGHHLAGVRARGGGAEFDLDADLLAVSGGFTPVAHLHMQAGGRLDWDAAAQAFIPAGARQNHVSAGAAAGQWSLAEALAGGWAAGGGEARAFAVDDPLGPGSRPGAPPAAPARGAGKAFVDFQNDVTLSDLDLAWREGYRSVEHLKRYTTLGMATDQGKTSAMPALARLAQAQGVEIPAAGLTTFRPPYTPTTLGALAGAAVGEHAAPRRRLALRAAHDACGAAWQPLGYWFRPRAYPRPGEGLAAAALREARTVRTAVGLTDVSTLAKFEIAGPDAAALLECVCPLAVGRLAAGRGRYVFMLREDGLVFDDGTVWRLAEDRFLLTSSTGGADRMASHLSYVRHVLRPGLKAAVTPVQEHYGAIAVAGPKAAAIVAEAAGAAPPAHMGLARVAVAGVPAWLLAASYSGERAFELHFPGDAAGPVWAALHALALREGGAPYGLDAMELLRIEKGHLVVGAEIDGRVAARDVGLHRMMRRNPDGRGGFVGAQALTRPAFAEPGRRQLVGLAAAAGAIPEGAMLVERRGEPPAGHVTSAGRRVLGDGAVALGLVHGGAGRIGQTLVATSPTRGIETPVRVVEPVFYDAEGARYRD